MGDSLLQKTWGPQIWVPHGTGTHQSSSSANGFGPALFLRMEDSLLQKPWGPQIWGPHARVLQMGLGLPFFFGWRIVFFKNHGAPKSGGPMLEFCKWVWACPFSSDGGLSSSKTMGPP